MMNMNMASVADESPFAIPHEHVQVLCMDEGFQILRSYLARDADFCADHATASSHSKETWLLHRDILHALVMPIYQLFSRASTLAEAALCTRNTEDLELAFSGEARGAFICLQCFIMEEEDWCRTRGCPACVTLATLSTESHIRLTIAASLLSTSPNTPTSSNASTPTSEAPTSGTTSGRTLPPLPHILPALRDALSSDPFWGPDQFEHILSRAEQLSEGIQALITECMDLEALVSSPTTRTSRLAPRRGKTLHPLNIQESNIDFPAPGQRENDTDRLWNMDRESSAEGYRNTGAKIKAGKVARRQQKMKEEEMDILRRCAMQCWARAAVPSKIRGELLGRGEKRGRSLTCP